MSYITQQDYIDITSRIDGAPSEVRLKRASRLFDARIGNYQRVRSGDYKGFKLPLDNLKDYQQDVVKRWVAWMTAALYDNGDSPDTFASITLGRFSVSENSEDTNNNLPEMVRFADIELRDAGLINTHVRSNRFVTQNEDYC